MRILFALATAAGMAAPGEGRSPDLVPRQDSTQTATLNDVTMPRQIEVEGQSLVLNGMALRKKAIFKVYVAGLYLPAKATDAEQVLAADAPRRLVMQFLRGVGANKMCNAWNEGLEANTPNASEALKAQYVTLCGWMEDIDKGEQFVFTYVPGQGTTVEVKGNTQGRLEGKEFADALFKSWIGPKPGPGEDFKRKLLGGS
ncbi:MAG: chalcone isomerase family protein [Gemmatimonadales bacterium]